MQFVYIPQNQFVCNPDNHEQGTNAALGGDQGGGQVGQKTQSLSPKRPVCTPHETRGQC